MNDLIVQLCRDLEETYSISMLVAVENGSRAWRISSKTSDYDIRFVFKRPLEEYIQLNKPPEVIRGHFDQNGRPCPIQEALFDLNGFDVFKYLDLLRKSNPTMIEWTTSDIVYIGMQNPVFQQFILSQFNPLRLYHSYKAICRNNYHKFIQASTKITIKAYLYVLRGLINAKWVATHQTIPPIIILDSLEGLNDQIPLPIQQILSELITQRKHSNEIIQTPALPKLDEFVEGFLNDDSEAPPARKCTELDELNTELQRIILA